MSFLTFKFGSSDLVRFIKIYRKHECLWNPQNANHKNRHARHAALAAFAEEFGVEGFGPREITSKIKNLRTQYSAQRKKIKESIGSESDSEEVYKPKLFWFELMDSFIRPTLTGPKETISDVQRMNDNSIEKQETVMFVDKLENTSEEDESATFEYAKRTSSSRNSRNPLGKQDYPSRQPQQVVVDDDLDNYGKYVTSTLRTLSYRNCIDAQDEIQGILSKYKLKNIEEVELKFSS